MVGSELVKLVVMTKNVLIYLSSWGVKQWKYLVREQETKTNIHLLQQRKSAKLKKVREYSKSLEF